MGQKRLRPLIRIRFPMDQNRIIQRLQNSYFISKNKIPKVSFRRHKEKQHKFYELQKRVLILNSSKHVMRSFS